MAVNLLTIGIYKVYLFTVLLYFYELPCIVATDIANSFNKNYLKRAKQHLKLNLV